MKAKLVGLASLTVTVLVLSLLPVGESSAGDNYVIGDLSHIAQCLGIPSTYGKYDVSAILMALADRAGIECGCAEASSPTPGRVVISGVLANAGGSTDAAEIPNEAISLRNVSACSIDLRDCQICDEQACWAIPASRSDAVLAPNAEITFYGREYNPTSYRQGISLQNDGETVKLECGASIIDSWSYPGGSAEGSFLFR